MYVPDNYDEYKKHEAEQEAWLNKRPICEECEEPIQDETLYDIGGHLYCKSCIDNFEKWTEDYERSKKYGKQYF